MHIIIANLIILYAFTYNLIYLHKIFAKAYNYVRYLANFIKTKRKEANLTQQEFAERAGVALTVVRKIEQGKENLSLSKVNQVLLMFGSKLVPANLKEIEK